MRLECMETTEIDCNNVSGRTSDWIAFGIMEAEIGCNNVSDRTSDRIASGMEAKIGCDYEH
jgi:hypothetical protein